jgi:ribosomal protein S18 acetylase RimI-like enzyme
VRGWFLARQIVVAEFGESVVGVASWGLSDVTDVPALELMSLYVHATQRGTGLAARLLYRAAGREPAHLWVFRDNPRAQAFYRKHGFRGDGSQKADPDTGLPETRYVRHHRVPSSGAFLRRQQGP